MDAMTGRHIIRATARNIPQERIDKGRVVIGDVGGIIRMGNIDIQIYHPTDEHGEKRARLIVMNHLAKLGGDVDPKVGETIRRPGDGIAVTLLTLGDDEGAQAVRLLIETCQDGPSIRLKADNPPQSRDGKTYEVRMGESSPKINKNYVKVSLGYGIMKQQDGTYLVPVMLGNGAEKPRDLSMSVGQSRTGDLHGVKYTVSLLALTDIHGHQGVTLLVTPVSKQ
ncbi:hypothetical protein PT279_04490 [Bifidobacterium sp. ESL0784]|uniref:hypothetical protein n=1 Tax=Bifidobacterium sp. ESL0784 TaxID=2983231 RepID=UPI0023F93C07|nr:hypothetical protein [Bifidobacterium sp. ESL0784]MDF7640846.1 hypothetical protein [Bifidobacterium sp. ESL0784]